MLVSWDFQTCHLIGRGHVRKCLFTRMEFNHRLEFLRILTWILLSNSSPRGVCIFLRIYCVLMFYVTMNLIFVSPGPILSAINETLDYFNSSKAAVSPMHEQWSYESLVQSHLYKPYISQGMVILFDFTGSYLEQNLSPTSLITPWTKWLPFRIQYFQMHFREWKVLYFDWNFTEFCSRWYNWQ